MQYYFNLQYRLLKRHVEDFGVPCWLAVILAFVVWLLYFRLVEQHPDWTPYGLIFFHIYLCVSLSGKERNGFLKLLFKPTSYRIVRGTENLLLSLPFILLFMVKGLHIFAFVSLLTSLLLANISFRMTIKRAFFAPFKRNPYEGQQFFRRFWWLLAILYLISFMGVISSNINLGIFSIAVTLFFFISVSDQIEPDYYVWNYAATPKVFILQKIKRLIVQLTILLAPIYIGLLLKFVDLFYIVVMMCLSTVLILATGTVIKYTYYARPISLPMGFLFSFCFLFPPLCLIVFPFFYKQAVSNLQRIL